MGVWVVGGAFQVARAVLPKRRSLIPVAGGIGALVSVPAAALVFAGLFVVGGAVPVEAGMLFAAMGSVHLLIGVGEALITGLVISAVVGVRPDLVHGARDIVRRERLAVVEVPA